MKKIFYVVLLFSLFIIGCGKSKEESPNGNTVVIAQGAKPKSLDPYMYNEIPGLTVTRQFYNTLFTKDEKGEIVPELAESYEFKSDKELDVVLKKGVKFHNGDEMTADDVVFSFQRMKEKPGSSIMVEEIDRVEKVDDYSVKIFLSHPSSPLLFNLAHPLTSILNKKYVESKNDDITVDPMGTGPYKFLSWGSGEKIEMESFKDYFLGAPKVDGIIFRAISEDSSRLAALETGEIDIAYGVAAIDAQTIEKNDKLELISEPTTSTEYITTNVTKAPFNNRDFRYAVAYAIDKQSIIDSIYLGKAKEANSIVNPNVFGYYDGLKGFKYDVEKAKEYLKKSGIEKPSFTLYINENPARLQAAQIIQANLNEIGIDVKIEILEWSTYLQKTADGDFSAFLGGWVSGTSDSDIVLYPLLSTASIGSAGNRSRYSNSVFDNEVAQARIVTTPEERKEHYKNAQLIFEEDLPIIPLYWKNENIGKNKRIKGFVYDATTMHKLGSLEIVK